MDPKSSNTIRIDKALYAKVLEARKKLPWANKEYVDMYFEFNLRFSYTKKN